MFCSFTPQPAKRMMRPAACWWSFCSRGAPSMAFGCWPEVRMRSKPKSISCSKASKESRQRSKARWKVRDIPFAFSTRRRLASMSIVPSSCKHPITMPSAPSWRATSMSALCHLRVFPRTVPHGPRLQPGQPGNSLRHWRKPQTEIIFSPCLCIVFRAKVRRFRPFSK